jgi:hypothetical protein
MACDFCAELSGAEVVVEHGDVDVVEDLGCLLNGGGWDAVVSVLAQDGSSEMQVGRFVVEQKDANV